MKPRVLIWCAVAAVLLVAAACSEIPGFFLYNNTGDEVVLRLAKEARYTDTPVDRLVRLKSGARRRIYFGETYRGMGVVSGSCDHRYRHWEPDNSFWRVVTEDGRFLGVYQLPVGVQLESDFRIYLRPKGSHGMTSVEAMNDQQPKGFPLLPETTNCPARPAG